MTITAQDRERLQPFLAGWHTLPGWLASDPPEEDLWKAYHLEKMGKARPRLLNRILTRAQKLMRIREVGEPELKYGHKE